MVGVQGPQLVIAVENAFKFRIHAVRDALVVFVRLVGQLAESFADLVSESIYTIHKQREVLVDQIEDAVYDPGFRRRGVHLPVDLLGHDAELATENDERSPNGIGGHFVSLPYLSKPGRKPSAMPWHEPQALLVVGGPGIRIPAPLQTARQ